MASILMIAPDDGLLAALRASPLLEGHSIEVARGETAALRQLRRRAFDVLISAPTRLSRGHGDPRRDPSRAPASGSCFSRRRRLPRR
jgi:hypothetical protein